MLAMSTGLQDSHLDRTTLRQQCLALLRERIADGTLKPGARLVETELSAMLDVSRGTVREALRHLEQEGLVAINDRGRRTVRALDVREVRDIYSVRAALESMAGCAIAARPDRDMAVAELRETLEPLRTWAGDFTRQTEADLAFHRRLCELAGNRTLVDTWSQLSGPVRSTIVSAGERAAGHLMSWERHAELVDAIQSGDCARTRIAINTHMEEAAAGIAVTVAANEREELV